MTDITTTDQPTRQQLAAIGRSAPGKVTGKLRLAIEAMVWNGLKRDAAAEHAGLKPHALYVAFRRPHVKAHYLAELDVLRTSARARNFHRLEAIAEQDENRNAAVAAIKAMEQLGDERSAPSGQALLPGLVIQIVNNTSADTQVRTIPGTDILDQ